MTVRRTGAQIAAIGALVPLSVVDRYPRALRRALCRTPLLPRSWTPGLSVSGQPPSFLMASCDPRPRLTSETGSSRRSCSAQGTSAICDGGLGWATRTDLGWRRHIRAATAKRKIILVFGLIRVYIGQKKLSDIVDRRGVLAGQDACGVCPPDGPTARIIGNPL